jgi:AcrR family transcriptional regulator
MPTGRPIHDIREQLFEAAERVLLHHGPDALTSRAVTTEAGVAKGILHRHFPDFDAFLAALTLTHLERLDTLSNELRATAGTGTVPGNLAGALAAALTPTTIRIIRLACSRHDLLARLRLTTPAGLPLATEITKMVAAYLTAERGLGRIAIETDVDRLAILLVGGAHLRANECEDLLLGPDDVRGLFQAARSADVDGQPRGAGRS